MVGQTVVCYCRNLFFSSKSTQMYNYSSNHFRKCEEALVLNYHYSSCPKAASVPQTHKHGRGACSKARGQVLP